MVLNDDGEFSGFASSGLTGDFKPFYSMMEQGYWPDCIRDLEAGTEPFMLRHSKDNCGDCPLRGTYPVNDILMTRISYKDKHLGYLSVTLPASLPESQEEIELFNGISENLGLAISNLDRLNKKEQAEQEKKKDKAAKVDTARTLWVPAVNNHGGFGRWAFVEISDPWDVENTIRAMLNGRSIQKAGLIFSAKE